MDKLSQYDKHETLRIDDDKVPHLFELYECIMALPHDECNCKISADEELSGLKSVVELIRRVRSNEEKATRYQTSPSVVDDSSTFDPNFSVGGNSDQRLEKLGRFKIERKLGEGGYAHVYLAVDPQLHRPIALKIPRPEVLITSELRERFLREGEAAAALDHPGIVQVFETGFAGPVCYIAMSFVDGVTLTEWLAAQEAPIEPKAAANLIATLAEAVQHAHSRGVLHRDLKPANVLLSPPQIEETRSREPHAFEKTPPQAVNLDRPRIADFGLAKLVNEQLDSTRTGSVIGTPSYMSPEQAESRLADVSTASDIYSLGAIFYELLTGSPPFQRETLLGTLEAVRAAEPTRPTKLRKVIPVELEAICLKCLEKEPQRRYASCAELAEDIHRSLEGRPVIARPTSRLDRTKKWCCRNPTLAVLGATLTITVLWASIGGYALWLKSEGHRSEALTRMSELNASNDALWTSKQIAESRRLEAEHARDLAEDERDAAAGFYSILVESFRESNPFSSGQDRSAEQVLERAAMRVQADDELSASRRASLLTSLGEALGGLGRTERSIELLSEALELFEADADPEAPTDIEVWCMVNLGWAYLQAGRDAQATATLRKAMTLAKQIWTYGDSRTQTARSHLALALRAEGEVREALQLLEELHEEQVLSLEASHPLLLTTKNNLALTLATLSRDEEAIPLYEEVVDRNHTRLGARHPSTLLPMENLGQAYVQVGKHDEGIRLLEQALDQWQGLLPENHPQLLQSMNNVARAYFTMGRYEDALPLIEECTKQAVATQGESHPNSLGMQANLATLYLRLGRPQEALPLLEAVHQSLVKVAGPTHPRTLHTLRTLATAHEQSGRFSEACNCFRELSRVLRDPARDPDQEPSLPTILVSLGRCELRRGRIIEAVSVLREAWSISSDARPQRKAEILRLFGECIMARAIQLVAHAQTRVAGIWESL